MHSYFDLNKLFIEHFGNSPRIFRSPGRINLIGEHTDYNQGFVMPVAVDKEIVLAIALSDTSEFCIKSIDQNEEVSFDLENYGQVQTAWAKYLIGVIDELLKKGMDIQPVNILFTGNIPQGAGMSSSAALECATVYALNEMFDLSLTKWELVKTAQAAENNYVGVQCGIMDQFASVFGQKHHALLLDCRSLGFGISPLLLDDYTLVLADTMVKHSLASSEYNTRREECDEGLEVLKKFFPELKSLRDVSLEQLETCREHLSDLIYKRCSYVVKEIKRVQDAAEALQEADFATFGKLMYETHAGLQHEYEVSCLELDLLVASTQSLPYVAGARMMGGGFGGCTINLVEKSQMDSFKSKLQNDYQIKFGKQAQFYEVSSSNGTCEIALDDSETAKTIIQHKEGLQ